MCPVAHVVTILIELVRGEGVSNFRCGIYGSSLNWICSYSDELWSQILVFVSVLYYTQWCPLVSVFQVSWPSNIIFSLFPYIQRFLRFSETFFMDSTLSKLYVDTEIPKSFVLLQQKILYLCCCIICHPVFQCYELLIYVRRTQITILF